MLSIFFLLCSQLRSLNLSYPGSMFVLLPKLTGMIWQTGRACLACFAVLQEHLFFRNIDSVILDAQQNSHPDDSP